MKFGIFIDFDPTDLFVNFRSIGHVVKKLQHPIFFYYMPKGAGLRNFEPAYLWNHEANFLKKRSNCWKSNSTRNHFS